MNARLLDCPPPTNKQKCIEHSHHATAFHSYQSRSDHDTFVEVGWDIVQSNWSRRPLEWICT